MKIRKKISYVLLFIFLLVLLSLIYVSYTIILKSFSEYEEEKVLNNILLTERAIEQEIDNLNLINGDWSRWDDVFEFVKGNFDTFPQSNLDFATLSNLRVDSMLFYNSSNTLIHSIAINLENKNETAISPNVLGYLEKNNLFKDEKSESLIRKGLVVIDDLAIFLSSQPVTKSTGEGEVAGRLIMLRFFNKAEADHIKSLVNQDFDYYPSSINFKDNPELIKGDLLGYGKIILPISEKEINSFVVLDDLNKNPSLIIKQNTSRSVYQKGKTSILFFIGTLFVFLAIIILALLLLLNKIIIFRILKLSNELEEIAKSGHFFNRVSVNDNDEITVVQNRINTTLTALERSLEKSKQSELELNKKSEDLEKTNNELEGTLEDFYTIRLTMQRDIEAGKLEIENEKIKKRLDSLKNKK